MPTFFRHGRDLRSIRRATFLTFFVAVSCIETSGLLLANKKIGIIPQSILILFSGSIGNMLNARGATFLGSGGGGDPAADCFLAEFFLQDTPLPLKPLSKIEDDEMVLCVASIGAPLVSAEKLSSGNEWTQVIHLVEEAIGRPVQNIVSEEIGGSNAFAGLIAARKTGRHFIDADSLGRAFPHLHISSCALSSVSPTPAAMVDVHNRY